jgi:hypothetical protein
VKIFGVKSFRERDKKKTSIKLSLPVLKLVKKKEADSVIFKHPSLKENKRGWARIWKAFNW